MRYIWPCKMTMANSKKVSIIGQGLAGSILSWKFIRSGWEVKQVCHSPGIPSASGVAGGLFNPITGRKLHLTWNATWLFNELHQFYPEIEKELNIRCFYPLPIHRIFDSIGAQNDGLSRAAQTEMSEFVNLSQFNPSGIFPQFKDDFGSISVNRGGYLDTPAFLNAMHTFFRQEGITEYESQVRFEDFEQTEDLVVWCTGNGLSGKSEFDALPFKPVKGEVLTVYIPDLNLETVVISSGIFIIPLGENRYRLGATYNWDISHIEPTEEARSHLTGTLTSLLRKPLPIEILDHKVGIRPAVKDRKPLIGCLQDHPNQWIFNGFGSKGVSLIPALAENLVQHLSGKSELPTEVSIYRFRRSV